MHAVTNNFSFMIVKFTHGSNGKVNQFEKNNNDYFIFSVSVCTCISLLKCDSILCSLSVRRATILVFYNVNLCWIKGCWLFCFIWTTPGSGSLFNSQSVMWPKLFFFFFQSAALAARELFCDRGIYLRTTTSFFWAKVFDLFDRCDIVECLMVNYYCTNMKYSTF